MTDYYTKSDLTGTAGVLKGYSLTSHTHDGYVPTSRTVAGQQLTANVTAATISSAIGLGSYSLTSHTHSGYVPTSRTVAGKALTANITAAELSTAVGLGNYSLTSHNHSGVYAPATHAHGNVTSDGKLQTTDVAIASGDKLVVTDSSDSSKVARTSLSFDGSTTTQFLTKKGTWGSVTGFVPTSTTVAGQQLTGNVTAATISSAIGLGSYVPTSRKVNGKQLTADITLKPADVSALALSGGTVTGDITLNGELTASGEFNIQGGIVSPYIAFDNNH